jgi:hypothetical protein
MSAPSPLAPRAPHARLARAGLALAGLALAAAGVVFVRYGRINHDEGWYLYAARLLYEGSLPYRDFPFYQAPFLPLLYGLPQLLWAGVETGRWTSFALSAATCTLALRLCFERGGLLAVAVFVGGLLGAPLGVWALVVTRTEPLSALLLMTAAFCLLRPAPTWRHAAVAVLAAALATATRITLAPAALFVALWALRRCARSGADALRILAPAALVAAAFGAVVLGAGLERAWANLVEIQAQRHAQFNPTPAIGPERWLVGRLHFLGLIGREYGPVTVLAAAAAVAFAGAWTLRADLRRAGGRVAAAGPVVLLLVLAFVPNLAPRSIFTVYFAGVLPLLLVLGGWGAAALRDGCLSLGIGRHWLALAFGLGALALALPQLSAFREQRDRWLVGPPSDLAQLREAARAVREIVPEDRMLFTFDTYLAVEAGRRVPPGFEMSVFSWFPQRPAEDGERLGLLTTDRLSDALRDPSLGAVALSDLSLGILVTRGHAGYQRERVLSEDEIRGSYPRLTRFDLVRTVTPFGQQRAPLYLLVPQPAALRAPPARPHAPRRAPR